MRFSLNVYFFFLLDVFFAVFFVAFGVVGSKRYSDAS